MNQTCKAKQFYLSIFHSSILWSWKDPYQHTTIITLLKIFSVLLSSPLCLYTIRCGIQISLYYSYQCLGALVKNGITRKSQNNCYTFQSNLWHSFIKLKYFTWFSRHKKSTLIFWKHSDAIILTTLNICSIVLCMSAIFIWN